jgi:ABC-type transporter Mla subunit MlaD
MMTLRDFPGFGALVDTLAWLIEKFDNKDLAFAIAILIIFSACSIWAFLHFKRHFSCVKPLYLISKKLQNLAKTTQDVTTILDVYSAIFATEPKIKPLWNEYQKNLKINHKTGGYLNLIDSRLYFSVENIPGRGYEQWCATWAGVFLTIGLLFTFIGLSAALLKVADIGAADSIAMKAAITGILGVSSAKFITSIAGLLAYIGFSITTRHYQSIQQHAASMLADSVQQISQLQTPESLLYEQNEIARKQLQQMERFTDDLAVAIDKTLETRLQLLTTNFEKHFDKFQLDLSTATAKPITDAMSGMTEQLADIKQSFPRETAAPIVEAIQNMTQNIAQDFSTQVQQSAVGEINTVATQFADLALALAKIKDDITGVGQNFGIDIKNAAATLMVAAQKMGKGVDAQSQELEVRIEQFSGKLDNISVVLTQIPNNIDRALKESLQSLALGGADGGNALRDSGQQAGSVIEQATKKLEAVIDNFASRLNTVETSLHTLPGAIAMQINHLNQAGQTFEAAGQTVVNAGDSLRQATEPMQQTAHTIQMSLEQIKQSIAKAETSYKQTGESIQIALGSLKDTAKTAQQVFITHEERFGAVDKELGKALITLRDGVEQVTRETANVFAEYDQHMTKVVSCLSVVAEGLQDAAEEISDSNKQILAARQQSSRRV